MIARKSIVMLPAAAFFLAIAIAGCGDVELSGVGSDDGAAPPAATEPLHPAEIHSEVPGGIGGNSRMTKGLHNMNNSGRLQDGRTYRWSWKWTGTRGGRDVVKFTFRVADEEPVEKEIEYGGGNQQVFDHPDLKVEIRPLPE